MTEENTDFDFKKALKGIQEEKPFTGKGGVLTSLIKNLAEAALDGTDSWGERTRTRARAMGRAAFMG